MKRTVIKIIYLRWSTFYVYLSLVSRLGGKKKGGKKKF